MIFTSEQFPKEWSQGLIFPIFKGGCAELRQDTKNYRGITLLSVVGKIYTQILNDRLYEDCEKNNLFCDEQAGFRKGRSTIDQLFILTETIKYHRPRKLFCAFLDLSK